MGPLFFCPVDYYMLQYSNLRSLSTLYMILQSLCKAREHEIESEEHFKIIAERELGRVRDEIQRLGNEMASIQEKKSDKEVCAQIWCYCSFCPH